MAIIYTWEIAQLDCAPEQDGYPNVVQTVHWRLRGAQDSYAADVYGTVGLPGPGQPFTSYDELTQTHVEGWVEDALGAEQVQAFKDNIAAQIANLITPPVVTPPLPWQA